MAQGLPESRVTEDVEIIAQADERAPEPRHAQIMLMERLPYGPPEREQRDEQDDRERRRREQPASARFARVVDRLPIVHDAFLAARRSRTCVRSTRAFMARAASCNARSGSSCPDRAR